MNIAELVARGALFFVSHSAGKDSQAMYLTVRQQVPHSQIVVVHADLGDVEWPGVVDHIAATVAHPVNIVRAGKTLLGMVEARGMWPSAKHRQCTSDLKRNPIEKFIRLEMKLRGAVLAVNCMGLRSEESPARARKPRWSVHKTLSKAGRSVWNWLPIFDLSTSDVFSAIASAGQKPHPAYEGNSRLSCVFCIMGCREDLRHGAAKNPTLFKRYADLEKRIGHTLFTHNGQPIGLEQYVGIAA